MSHFTVEQLELLSKIEERSSWIKTLEQHEAPDDMTKIELKKAYVDLSKLMKRARKEQDKLEGINKMLWMYYVLHAGIFSETDTSIEIPLNENERDYPSNLRADNGLTPRGKK